VLKKDKAIKNCILKYVNKGYKHGQ